MSDMEPGAWFPARYSGECPNCGDPFEKGQRIRKGAEGDYECCPPIEDVRYLNGDHDAARRLNEVICDRCRLVKPCFCD